MLFNKMKEIREIAMLTQKEFAKELGLSPYTIWSWENGTLYPSKKNQRKIVEFCKQHNIDLEELKRQANDGK